MKKWLVKIVLLIVYLVPFTFLSMYGDAEKNTMLLYSFMIICLAFLCYVSVKSRNIVVCLIGNIVSYLSSYLFMTLYRTDTWQWYFKPFTATGLLITISVISLMLQAAFMHFLNSRKKGKTNVTEIG